MNVKILNLYIERCRRLKVEPTFIGLNLYARVVKPIFRKASLPTGFMPGINKSI